VIDTNIEFVWSNDLGLELWRAEDLDDLLERDLKTGAPERVLTRLEDIFARVAAGERLREEYVFYPKGEPLMLVLDLRAIELPDGDLGLLNQALPFDPQVSDSARRALTIARQSSTIRLFVAADGSVLTMNSAAIRALSKLSSWPGCIVEAGLGADILARALAGERLRVSAQVRLTTGVGWQQIGAEQLRDPVSGELGVLIEHVDDAARIEAENRASAQATQIDELSAALALVERQRAEILELSAPILDVGAQTLAVPLIGRLSEDKGAELTARLLEAVNKRQVRQVILDLTGAESVGDEGLGRLVRMIRALRMLGASATLTGVRPELATELVSLGVELPDVEIARTLAEHLHRHSFRRP
jgi:anti-anti-sigma regulatory factor